MKTKQCEEAHELLTAIIDDEFAGVRRREAEAHLAGCARCQALADDYVRLGAMLRDSAYQKEPTGLEDRIRQRISTNAGAAAAPARWNIRPLLRQAAALIVACGLSAFVSWQWATSSLQQQSLEKDVIAAHVRSLLQDNPVQIASTDRHTVRPWFNGRLEFAPEVKDLSNQGFPLVGGRIDWIDGKRVATIVYKRRLHTINVFLWPDDAKEARHPADYSAKGFNVISWQKDGMRYSAVSDLNAKELAELQSLL